MSIKTTTPEEREKKAMEQDYLYIQLDDIRKKTSKNTFLLSLSLIGIIVIIILLLFFHKCECNCMCKDNNNGNEYVTIEQETVINKNNTQVSIPVFPSLWNLSKESGNVELYNPKDNDVYLEYIILDKNKNTIYTSKKLTVGEKYVAPIGCSLALGEHECTVVIKSYDTLESSQNSVCGNIPIKIIVS